MKTKQLKLLHRATCEWSVFDKSKINLHDDGAFGAGLYCFADKGNNKTHLAATAARLAESIDAGDSIVMEFSINEGANIVEVDMADAEQLAEVLGKEVDIDEVQEDTTWANDSSEFEAYFAKQNAQIAIIRNRWHGQGEKKYEDYIEVVIRDFTAVTRK